MCVCVCICMYTYVCMYVYGHTCMRNEQLKSCTDPRHPHCLWCSAPGCLAPRRWYPISILPKKKWGYPWGGGGHVEVESEYEYERVVNPWFVFVFKPQRLCEMSKSPKRNRDGISRDLWQSQNRKDSQRTSPKKQSRSKEYGKKDQMDLLLKWLPTQRRENLWYWSLNGCPVCRMNTLHGRKM
jgi:hypothetical protein